MATRDGRPTGHELRTSAALVQFERDGVIVVPDVVTPEVGAKLADALADLASSAERRRGGARDPLTRVPSIRPLAASPALRAIVDAILSPSAFVVRALFFDKTPTSNWTVPWHQDTTIVVSHRADGLEGYGPWSSKAGAIHVQPPAHVLERMVTVRVHLDECGASNGALRVIPGSHRAGIAPHRPSGAWRTCPVPRGGALVMRPLLWHASAKADSPTHRRVIHLEFADAALPPPLRWHEHP